MRPFLSDKAYFEGDTWRVSTKNTTPQHDIIFYSSPDGHVKVDVFYTDETFWRSQKKMAELFGRESHTITYHLKEIVNTHELT